ncbi:MAG: dihydrodipicolinate synthase family protein [Aggregatilineales bacterium]
MTMNTEALLDGLNSVISIPLIPYAGEQIDYDGHAKNIEYLLKNNYLSDNRPRVISIAGTSLIHHVGFKEQIHLMDVTGQQMGKEGILIAAIVPNPIGDAGDMIAQMSKLQRPPDVYLLMPLTGTYSPEGLYSQFMQFTAKYGTEYDARFLYYYRRARDRDFIIRLIKESPHVIGVKIGTDESDVKPFIDALDESKIVIWGIGDRSTDAAQLGAKGHTSGINIFAVRASDEINNAQRRKDYDAAREIEAQIAPLEDIRFLNERAYNYSAVMEIIIVSGVEDVVAGTGGPFNPRVPSEVGEEITRIADNIRQYH